MQTMCVLTHVPHHRQQHEDRRRTRQRFISILSDLEQKTRREWNHGYKSVAIVFNDKKNVREL